MKKYLLIFSLVILALGAFSVGVAAAQGQQPPVAGHGPGMMGNGGSGFLNDYMVKALADTLGLPVEEFESRHNAGETFYEIAIAQGFTADELPAMMLEARNSAVDAALADGVLTQEQADWMKTRGFGRGNMQGGYGDGTCPMYGTGQVPPEQPGTGFIPEQGMMGRGYWQQNNQ